MDYMEIENRKRKIEAAIMDLVSIAPVEQAWVTGLAMKSSIYALKSEQETNTILKAALMAATACIYQNGNKKPNKEMLELYNIRLSQVFMHLQPKGNYTGAERMIIENALRDIESKMQKENPIEQVSGTEIDNAINLHKDIAKAGFKG